MGFWGDFSKGQSTKRETFFQRRLHVSKYNAINNIERPVFSGADLHTFSSTYTLLSWQITISSIMHPSVILTTELASHPVLDCSYILKLCVKLPYLLLLTCSCSTTLPTLGTFIVYISTFCCSTFFFFQQSQGRISICSTHVMFTAKIL